MSSNSPCVHASKIFQLAVSVKRQGKYHMSNIWRPNSCKHVRLICFDIEISLKKPIWSDGSHYLFGKRTFNDPNQSYSWYLKTLFEYLNQKFDKIAIFVDSKSELQREQSSRS